MPLEWVDDDEKPAGGRPASDDADDSEDLDDGDEEDSEESEGEWIVDPADPEYEIFVPDKDDDEEG